jgi:ABC-type branched-subunit amino acid transport system ATPase component
MPGGRAVFPTLTVKENLQTAIWTRRNDDETKSLVEDVYRRFPRLRERDDQPAGNLSGGEQQMLGLGMALVAQPRLLMIDELSLGLAPIVVGELLEALREIHRRGTTIVLVEQSVNVALTVAQRAVFLEKGQVRFEGRTADLLKQKDVLRSVFLEGAAGGIKTRSRAKAPVEPTSARPLLEVEGVGVSFGGIRAVDNVSFSVAPGEVVGFIGPNGAGKTTLFDVISGYVRSDSGTVRLDGHDITATAPNARARLGLGRSFQDARLFPSMTVREAISVAHDRHLRLRDPLSALVALPDQRVEELLLADRVDELMALLGLDAFADKFVSELSTGSRRIVDIACALAHDPKVLMLDEPSSGVAQRETEELGPVLRSVQQATGAALIVIEHDMPLISSLSDRLVALDLGQVIATGSPDDVLHDERVMTSYLGGDLAAVERSGARTTKKRTTKKLAAAGVNGTSSRSGVTTDG